MKTIATFTTPEDAHLFRAFLGAQEIEAFLDDENFAQLFWFYSNAIGGVRVSVNDSDADHAIEAHRTYMAALREGPYPINPVRAWPVVILLSLVMGVPFILFGRRSLPGRVRARQPRNLSFIHVAFQAFCKGSNRLVSQLSHA